MSELRPVPDEVVTSEELAVLLKVSPSTVKRWRGEGMPWHPWGRRLVRFRVREVMCWLDEQDQHEKAA